MRAYELVSRSRSAFELLEGRKDHDAEAADLVVLRDRCGQVEINLTGETLSVRAGDVVDGEPQAVRLLCEAFLLLDELVKIGRRMSNASLVGSGF